MEPVLKIVDVEKSFGDFRAVTGVNLEIGRGEFLAIMGSSGSGKSTLLRMIAGLEAPTKGDILLNGRSTRGLAPHERDTPMVWQSLALFPFLNVVENVEFGLKMRGVPAAERRRRALSWLERLEIGRFADRAIDELSGGQRQRVALARALVTEPPVLLLDEPLSALDAHLSVRMQAVLTNLQRELGITFIYVTHSHSEAFAMADRVVIMSEGRIEQIGAPKEIYLRPSTRFVAEFLGSNNIFTGRPEKGADGSGYLRTGDGLLKLPADADPALFDGEVDLIVSADRIVLGGPSQANSLPCRLIGEEFVGASVNLYLETEGGRDLVVQMPQRQLDGLSLQRGAAIAASWSDADGHVIRATS
ncbi:MAG: ABC transporter ATP-binding protein [Alphaproteobacteria bacterium]